MQDMYRHFISQKNFVGFNLSYFFSNLRGGILSMEFLSFVPYRVTWINSNFMIENTHKGCYEFPTPTPLGDLKGTSLEIALIQRSRSSHVLRDTK